MSKYAIISELSDDRLIQAYKELKEGKLPAGEQSIVRRLQGSLSKEEGKPVAIIKTKYLVAMEMLSRFYDKGES